MRESKKMIVASLLAIALIAVGRDSLKSDHVDALNSIDGLLEQFDAAIASADAQKLETLLLPPDKTENGKNRQANLAEARKDWAGGKSGPPVNLTPRRALIHIEMEERVPDGPTGGRIGGIELRIVSTDKGWRIESMRRFAKPPEAKQ